MDSKNSIILRDVVDADADLFFEHQLDPEAIFMAAFTADNPADKNAFNTKWVKIRSDKTVTVKTILYNDLVAGHMACHSWFGKPEVTYWIGKKYWGNGIAAQALSQLTEIVTERPLYARVATDNIASIKVLRKCGFLISGNEKGFANGRGKEIEEFVMELK